MKAQGALRRSSNPGVKMALRMRRGTDNEEKKKEGHGFKGSSRQDWSTRERTLDLQNK